MLTTRVKISGDTATLTLEGDLDENAVALLAKIEGSVSGVQTLLVRCGGLNHINSFGIGKWVELMVRLSTTMAIELHDCPAVMIDYASILPDVTAFAEVVSVLFPLRCKACKTSSALAIRVDEVASLPKALAAAVCGRCGAACAADVDPETFFGFTSNFA